MGARHCVLTLARPTLLDRCAHLTGILQRETGTQSALDRCLYCWMSNCVKFSGMLHLNRKSDVMKVGMKKKFKQEQEERRKHDGVSGFPKEL